VAQVLPGCHPGWKQAVDAVHEDVAQRAAQSRGTSTAEWQREVDAWLERQLTNVEVRVRMKPYGFSQFVSEGRYTTQFERPGVSGGAKHLGVRILVEHTVLGVPPDCAAADRPVYGYLSGSGEDMPSLQQYGPFVLHLKAGTAARTTFTGADSLDFVLSPGLTDPCVRPAPVLAPHRTALPAHDFSIGPSGFVRSDVDPLAHTGFADLTSYGYAEAQIHGGLGLSDVERVTGTLGARLDTQVVQRLADSGVAFSLTESVQP
jgi:hypothetical protein